MAQVDTPSELSDLDPAFVVGVQRLRFPEDLFAKLVAYVEAECANPDRSNFDYSLVGRITHGEQIHAADGLDPAIKAFLCMSGRSYVLRMAQLNRIEPVAPLMVDFVDSWIVKSVAGDYNPMHDHSDSLAGVINIAIPPSVTDAPEDDGKLVFMFGQRNLPALNFFGTRSVAPVAGDMFLFPSWMHHAVYPFEGEGERITFAFNLNIRGNPFSK